MARSLKVIDVSGVCTVSEFISPADVHDNDTISESSVLQHEAALDHANILNAGANSHPVIDSHIGDGGLHFTEASIDHDTISSTGTNTHALIDDHIADLGLHSSSSERYYGQQIAVTNTTSTVFAVHQTFTTPVLSGGIYRVEWSYGFSNNTVAQGAVIQIRQPGGTPNGDPVQADLLNYVRLDPQDSAGSSRIGGTGTDQENSSAGFLEFVLPAAAATFVVEFRSTTGAITSVWGSKLSIVRVG